MAPLAACVPNDWVVYVSGDATVDVVVRVTFEDGSRDVFMSATDEGQVIALDAPHPPARVELLDALTCESLAVGDLPIGRTIVTYIDDPAGPGVRMTIGLRNVGRAESDRPEDYRCKGS